MQQLLHLQQKRFGNENVLTVAMPCQSNKGDLEDAKLVSETFGVKLLEINLTDTYEKLEDEINYVLKEDLSQE